MKQKLQAHREMLISELEPRLLTSILSKSKAFPQKTIENINDAPSCFERTQILLSYIEKGESKVLDDFLSALRDAGYHNIVELIEPTDLHKKAGKLILSRRNRRCIHCAFTLMYDDACFTLCVSCFYG